MVRFAGTCTVMHRRRTGALPCWKSTRASPVPRSEGSTPSTSPTNAFFRRSSSSVPRDARPGRAGMGLPASFAVHICRDVILAMGARLVLPGSDEHLDACNKRERQGDVLEDALVNAAKEPSSEEGPRDDGGRELGVEQ